MQACISSRAAFGCKATVRPAQANRTFLTVCNVQDVKGTVVSTAMDKTVVVAVERFRADETYEKRVRITKRYFAHDEKGDAKMGDFVLLKGTRPLSKTKRFAVAEVLRKAE